MIRRLQLTDTGPSRALSFDFAPRMNVLAGDNGLGKTFVLDVIWWALTTTWVGEQAFPWRPPSTSREDRPALRPDITAVLAGPAPDVEIHAGGVWRWERQEWEGKPQRRRRRGDAALDDTPSGVRTPPTSLIVYARIDGTFAIWDALQTRGKVHDPDRAAVFMEASEVWEGKRAASNGPDAPRIVCRGLIEDWVSWQGTRAPEFASLQQLLTLLSEPSEPLKPGRPTRVRVDDRRDIPTLDLPQGVVPVTLASAGMKRILSLAYLLVWAWTEHQKAAELLNRPPAPDMVVLIDEVELHLHPRWQRTLLPAVHKAIAVLSTDLRPQFFVTTHAPMVLASLETVFDEEVDDLLVLERDGSVIRAQELPFVKEGDVTGWLSSEVFGRIGGRSREAALAEDAAQDFLAGRENEASTKLLRLERMLRGQPAPDGMELLAALGAQDDAPPLIERIHAALAATLPGHDAFWAHWSLVYRRRVASEGG
ncbi:MAG: AAA family ATPase [Alphaproteobacteria bacterium]|nr:AAA family ATPase [Alphaproteobacteria bacterium]